MYVHPTCWPVQAAAPCILFWLFSELHPAASETAAKGELGNVIRELLWMTDDSPLRPKERWPSWDEKSVTLKK